MLPTLSALASVIGAVLAALRLMGVWRRRPVAVVVAVLFVTIVVLSAIAAVDHWRDWDALNRTEQKILAFLKTTTYATAETLHGAIYPATSYPLITAALRRLEAEGVVVALLEPFNLEDAALKVRVFALVSRVAD